MTTSLFDPARGAGQGAPVAPRTTAPSILPAIPAPLGRAIVAFALLLGIAGRALLGAPQLGLGFPIWVAIFGLSATALTWRAARTLPGESARWLVTAVLFAAAIAWRDSDTLQTFDTLAALAALGLAAVAMRDPRTGLGAERLRDTAWTAATVARRIAAGIVPLALRELFAPQLRGQLASRGRRAVRATLIAGAVLLVFGSLLRSADPIFASVVRLPDLDVGALVVDGVVIAAFAWLTGGWAIGALADDAPARAPEQLPLQLDQLDVTAALGTLNVLFGAFVLAQLGWFFGGERFLQDRTGLTAAAYARGGFFQVVLVALLVVPVLIGTRAAIRPDRALERRHTALSLPVIALLGAIILSAVSRLRLYVHYYGLTTDRLYPLVFLGWLALVLAWLAMTVLRGRGQRFVSGAALTGLATLAGLNVAAPDAIVARVNIDRAAHAPPGTSPALDLDHLSSLSGEAADQAIAAVLMPSAGALGTTQRDSADAQRCLASRRLLGRWTLEQWSYGDQEADGPDPIVAQWRSWNAGRWRARAAVESHASRLWATRIATCRSSLGRE